MENNWLSVKYIEQQEQATKLNTEDFFGKGRTGFCDYALDGIDIMIHGALYLMDNDVFIDKDKIIYNDFKHALRLFSYYHFYRVIYTFKAAYNQILQGYYTESAFLMRNIVETFVRLRYIAKESKIDLIDLAFAGHRRFEGKKKITYRKQFDDIAPGLYTYYQLLCDMTHGSMASHALKSDLSEGTIKLDTGIVFKPEKASFVINQYSVYLLAHIEFMMWVFPEIKKKMPEKYAEKYHETLTILWRLMKNISENNINKEWYNAVQHLVRI